MNNKYDAAIKTLGIIGYTYTPGAELWKPPLGNTSNIKPVYTQEMADNGVMPSVGMECMVYVEEHYECDKLIKEWFKATVCGGYKGSPVVRLYDLSDGTEGYFDVFSLNDIKPLTPPVGLVDGKAYQFFDRCNKPIYGIYNKDREILSVDQGQYFDVIAVSDIKLLEVKS